MFKKINRENKKGFTLAELLIVVAIIGVLVAISIPIFTAQLEKAREATDLSNTRAAYAEVMADALLDETKDSISREVTWTQRQSGWQTTVDSTTIADVAGGVTLPAPDGSGSQTVTVAWVPTSGSTPGHVTITAS